MFSFFKKKIQNTKKKIDISIDSDLVQKYYISKVKNYTWDNYEKLDKYEKVYAFSAHKINDIDIINALREARFNIKKPSRTKDLSKEIKINIKSSGLFLKDIPSLLTINSLIYFQLSRYLQKDFLPLSQYIRISSPLLETSPKIETALHNKSFHRDEKELYAFIPPNHPADHSTIMFLRESILKKYNTSSICSSELKKEQHQDYDFNVYQYIIDDYLKDLK